MPAPAVWLAVPLVLGAALGTFAVHGTAGPPAMMLVAAWVCVVSAFAWRQPRLLVAACATASLCAGLLLGMRAAADAAQPTMALWQRARSDGDAPVRLTGRLRADAGRTATGASFILDVESVHADGREAPLEGGVRVSVAGSLASQAVERWRQDRGLSLDIVTREPIDYRDPGVPSDRLRLARQGIYLLGSTKSAALVALTARGSTIAEAAASCRAWVRRAIAVSVGRWSSTSAGVVTAILIGDRTGLDPEDERRLQDAGTYHVIAISGGNVALLTVMLIAAGRVLRVPPRASAAASILFLAGYGYTAGLAASVLRATLAGVVYMSSQVVDQRGAPLNALAVAAACAVAVDPLTVLDAGFILSFGATLGIILAASRLVPARGPRGRPRLQVLVRAALLAVAGLGAATMSAELALGPVSAQLFGRVTFAGLGLNFIAIPLMSIIQVAGMAAVAVQGVWPLLASGCGWIAHVGTIALLRSAALVDAAPWLVRDVPPPAMWVVALWYAGCAALLASWAGGWGTRLRVAGGVLVLLSGILVFDGPVVARRESILAVEPGWTRVVFLDVGQGDATLVWPDRSPPMLIDAGGAPNSGFDLGRRVTVPALWALRLNRLGPLVLTHGDPDHIGGAPAVLRALRPSEVWEGIPVPRQGPMQALHAAATGAGMAWVERRTGQRIPAGAATITVLNPPDPDWERQKVRNDDSIVLEVRVGDVAFVFPGDISRAVEPDVAAHFSPAPIVILKAPHHGSAGSSSQPFIDALEPRAVVFSAGQRNPFGHPAAVVVARYQASGVDIFSTAADGAVVMDTDGRQVEAWTVTGRRAVIVPRVRATKTPR